LKSAADLLRKGADEGHVTGVFDLDGRGTMDRIRGIVDLPLADEESRSGQLLLTRRLFTSGRTRVSPNGNPITLAELRQVGDLPAHVHGQHDSAYLLKPGNQLEVVDEIAGLEKDRAAYGATRTQLQTARRRLTELAGDRDLRRQTLELYRFQADEIDKAGLAPAEFERLQQRAGILENLETLKTDSAEAFTELY